MIDLQSTLDAIDAVTRCGGCETPLTGREGSLDFCGETCQERWHHRRGKPPPPNRAATAEPARRPAREPVGGLTIEILGPTDHVDNDLGRVLVRARFGDMVAAVPMPSDVMAQLPDAADHMAQIVVATVRAGYPLPDALRRTVEVVCTPEARDYLARRRHYRQRVVLGFDPASDEMVLAQPHSLHPGVTVVQSIAADPDRQTFDHIAQFAQRIAADAPRLAEAFRARGTQLREVLSHARRTTDAFRRGFEDLYRAYAQAIQQAIPDSLQQQPPPSVADQMRQLLDQRQAAAGQHIHVGPQQHHRPPRRIDPRRQR